MNKNKSNKPAEEAEFGKHVVSYIGLNHMSFDHRMGEWKTIRLKLINSFIAGDIKLEILKRKPF